MVGKRRNALVAFFEVQDKDGVALDEPVDWQETLSYIASQEVDDRRHMINGTFHWGQVYAYKEADHFILARRRDEVSSLNTSTGEIVDTESDLSQPWVEVSILSFLPDTNRFGLVLGSNAAPRVSSFAHWLNTHQVLDDTISIAPVLDRRVAEKVGRADGASMVRVSFESDRVLNLQHSRGLYEVAQELKRDYGDVVVDLQLKITKKHGGESERTKLLWAIKRLMGADAYDKAKAGLVWWDAEGSVHRENVDFVKHRLAKQTKITVTDKTGESVKIKSALDAIEKAADALKEDLYDATA